MSLINYESISSIIPYDYCFRELFKEQTALKSAKYLMLSPTSLKTGCYWSMFDGCINLSEAPELPATTLADNCYTDMFDGCISLVKAPKLMAKQAKYHSYSGMFNGCSKLSYIVCNLEDASYQGTTYPSWVSGVAATGTFVKNPIGKWESGDKGIPNGWIISALVNEFTPTTSFTPSSYVTATALADYSTIGAKTISNEQTLYFSKNGTDWKEAVPGEYYEFNENEKFYICGNLNSDNSVNNYTNIILGGSVNLSGNVNSIWSYSNPSVALKNYCGACLFADSIGLIDTSNLQLASSTLSEGCYYGMFSACTALNNTPELPATTLATSAYCNMFIYCTALTGHPTTISATTIPNGCCSYMFGSCESMTSAPNIECNSVSYAGCQAMFSNCKSLIVGPELPATTLSMSAYSYMFNYCTSMTSCTESLPCTSITNDVYDSMFRGCNNLIDPPIIRSKSFSSKACIYMFYNCSKLSSLPISSITYAQTYAFNDAFNGCTSLTDASSLKLTYSHH